MSSSEPFDFVNRANAEYIDQLHEQYLKDPRSVPEQWRAFFAGFEVGWSEAADEARPSAADRAAQHGRVRSGAQLSRAWAFRRQS